MIEYVYIVKCPNCEDEHFYFFDDAKTCAMGCLSQKPIITQTEVNRNDFGECTDHCDLGTVWSWEDVVGKETDAEPAISVFTKDDFKQMADGKDPELDDDDFLFDHGLVEATTRVSFKNNAEREEFHKLCREIGIITGADLRKFMDEQEADDDNLIAKLRAYRAELGDDFKIEECARKPIPEGMTIEELVEEMEENEDTVECTWCNDLFDKSECRKEVDLGWLCGRCEAAIKSRGETLTFRENNYWDFLDEDTDKPLDEAANQTETVDIEYDALTITVAGNQRDVDDWDEAEHTGSYTYTVDKNDVADVIYEEFLTDEDVAEVPGGKAALEDDDLWEKFIVANFDSLFDKYYDQIHDYYEEEATEAFSREFTWEDYLNYEAGERADRAYQDYRDSFFEESITKEVSNLDKLEEDTEYSKRLISCPECGKGSYDSETGFCITCGFN